jgi:hypothetical protein
VASYPLNGDLTLVDCTGTLLALDGDLLEYLPLIPLMAGAVLTDDLEGLVLDAVPIVFLVPNGDGSLLF